MISKDELNEMAKTKNYNLGQAEKSYLQDILLFTLYQEFGPELVFKGGTALSKCYGLDRFSQDLDFTLHSKKDLKPILTSGLQTFLIPYELEEKEYEVEGKIIFRLQGPLYTGNRMTLCRLELDVSLRETILLKPQKKRIGYLTPELPAFWVMVMAPKEIVAEKVRAILTRETARDLYDLHYLLDMKTRVDPQLIEEKLQYYNTEFSLDSLNKALQRRRENWDKELKALVKQVPPFREILEETKTRFREAYR